MPGPQKNMSVNVLVNLNGYQDGPTQFNIIATYLQSDCLPLVSQVVFRDGNIYLEKLIDPNNQYNAATDLVFWLDSNSVVLDLNGNPLQITYPPGPLGNGINFPGNSNSQFSRLDNLGTDSALGFTDADTVSGSYQYCLTVWAGPKGNNPNNANGLPIALDPQIVNKPS